eukprot:6893320-Alexandrium_andersonii.AAC.1
MSTRPCGCMPNSVMASRAALTCPASAPAACSAASASMASLRVRVPRICSSVQPMPVRPSCM